MMVLVWLWKCLDRLVRIGYLSLPGMMKCGTLPLRFTSGLGLTMSDKTGIFVIIVRQVPSIWL